MITSYSKCDSIHHIYLWGGVMKGTVNVIAVQYNGCDVRVNIILHDTGNANE